MKFNYEMDEYADLEKSTLKGSIALSYGEMVEIFGEPTLVADEGKTRAEWRLVVNDDYAIAVYDWKTYDIPIRLVDRWNVGSRDSRALGAIQHIILNNLKPRKTNADKTVQETKRATQTA